SRISPSKPRSRNAPAALAPASEAPTMTKRCGAIVQLLRQFDVPEQRVVGSADLVLDESAAGREVELPELNGGIDEPVRVSDEGIGGVDGAVDAERVRLVVLVRVAEDGPTARAGQALRISRLDEIEVLGQADEHGRARVDGCARLAAQAFDERL